MFFAGLALWHLWPGTLRQPAKWTVLSLSLIFTLLALFFLFGGDTLARFQSHSGSAISQTTGGKGDFRLSIQKDALRFSRQNPWLGVGLGNFEPPLRHRPRGFRQPKPRRPSRERLALDRVRNGLARRPPSPRGNRLVVASMPSFQTDKRGESLRRALVITVLMFLCHGLVDVSGHRLGSLWFALLLAGLALPTTELIDPAEPFFITARRAIPLLFRGIALLIMAVAIWWSSSLNATIGLAATAEDNINSQLSDSGPVKGNLSATTYDVIFHGNRLPPTSADLARLQTRILNMIAERRVDAVEELTNAALKIAPIDWTLYFERAWAEVYQKGQLSQAGIDFQVARVLEPHWARHCLNEGAIWLAVDQPNLCVNAWQEALRRDPASSHDLFTDMMRRSSANDFVRKDLADLAATNTDYLLIFLDNATPKETQGAINRLLALDQTSKPSSPPSARPALPTGGRKATKPTSPPVFSARPTGKTRDGPGSRNSTPGKRITKAPGKLSPPTPFLPLSPPTTPVWPSPTLNVLSMPTPATPPRALSSSRLNSRRATSTTPLMPSAPLKKIPTIPPHLLLRSPTLGRQTTVGTGLGPPGPATTTADFFRKTLPKQPPPNFVASPGPARRFRKLFLLGESVRPGHHARAT